MFGLRAPLFKSCEIFPQRFPVLGVFKHSAGGSARPPPQRPWLEAVLSLGVAPHGVSVPHRPLPILTSCPVHHPPSQSCSHPRGGMSVGVIHPSLAGRRLGPLSVSGSLCPCRGRCGAAAWLELTVALGGTCLLLRQETHPYVSSGSRIFLLISAHPPTIPHGKGNSGPESLPFRAQSECNSISKLKPASTQLPLALTPAWLPDLCLTFTHAPCWCDICLVITVRSHHMLLKRICFIKFKY